MLINRSNSFSVNNLPKPIANLSKMLIQTLQVITKKKDKKIIGKKAIKELVTFFAFHPHNTPTVTFAFVSGSGKEFEKVGGPL